MLYNMLLWRECKSKRKVSIATIQMHIFSLMGQLPDGQMTFSDYPEVSCTF